MSNLTICEGTTVKRTAAVAVLSAAVLCSLTACSSGGPSADKAPEKAPAYRIVKQDGDGNQRTVTVEVKTTKNLRAVFDDVAGKLTEEAGYFVEINCATGGTAKVDNRLANGRKAVGNMGAAATGLEDGQTEYEAQSGATCPE